MCIAEEINGVCIGIKRILKFFGAQQLTGDEKKMRDKVHNSAQKMPGSIFS